MNEPREKFLGISDAINSSSHSFTRVKFSSCFLHCRRCRRGSSWHPLEEDQSRKWVPTWKCTLPFPYECHQGRRMPLGEFRITVKSSDEHETSDIIVVYTTGLSIVSIPAEMLLPTVSEIPPTETFNFLRGHGLFGIKTRFSSRKKKEE